MQVHPLKLHLALATVSLVGWHSAAVAGEWSQFRGPNSAGVAETSRLPVEFGPRKNVAWKTTIPNGKSSPVLTADRIFLTASEGDDLLTICLERASGKILWRRAIRRDRAEPLNQLNTPASSTPTTDGRNVYVFFGDFGLVSYGPDGNERWRLRLGPFKNLHGMASSPVLVGDKLIMLHDQAVDSHLLAVNKDTGETLWRTERPEALKGFSTPVVFQAKDGPPQLIVTGSFLLISYSVESGEKLWWVRGLTWQMKSSAVIGDDIIYATGWSPSSDAGQRMLLPSFEEALQEADIDHDGKLSFNEIPEKWHNFSGWRPIDLVGDGSLSEREWSLYRARRAARNVTIAVRPGKARGDLTETHLLWEYERSVPRVPSPLFYKGILYTIKDGGILTSFDAKTGKVLRQARLRDAIDTYYSSPVAGDNKVYLASELGKVSVLQVGGEWETLAVNDLREPCYASPAIADGRLFIRTATTLYAFEKVE